MRKITFILIIIGLILLGILYIGFFVIGQITSGMQYTYPDPNQNYSIVGSLMLLSIPLLFVVFSIQRFYNKYKPELESKGSNWLKL